MFRNVEDITDFVRSVLAEFEDARCLQGIDQQERLKWTREFAEYLEAKIITEDYNAQVSKHAEPCCGGACEGAA